MSNMYIYYFLDNDIDKLKTGLKTVSKVNTQKVNQATLSLNRAGLS